MKKGTVKWFDAVKGYGFIVSDDKSADVFVHYSVIDGQGYRSLTEGQAVEYETTQTPKGLAATRVVVIE